MRAPPMRSATSTCSPFIGEKSITTDSSGNTSEFFASKKVGQS
jgi:hypothetical protein